MKQIFFRFIKSATRWLLLLCVFFAPLTIVEAANLPVAQSLSLERLELMVEDGPEATAMSAALDRDEALQTLQDQRTGAKYFGGVTYGYSNEPIFDTSEEKNRYNKLSVTGGLTFPLMGTLHKEKIDKIEADIALLKTQRDSGMLLLNNLVLLRKAYTTLWIEQQKVETANRFLQTEAETSYILQERQNQGLLLPTDRLEFLAVYSDVRRDIAASQLRRLQAWQAICRITGHSWEAPAKVAAPTLPLLDGKRINLSDYPEIVFQKKLVSQYEKRYDETSRIDREADLTVGLTAARDYPGALGNGAYITFTMKEPVKQIGTKDQAKLAAANDLTRARNEELFFRIKINSRAEETLAELNYAAADVNARTAHLIVMAEEIREKTLRHAVLPGDTFEQLQHSKSQYYRTVMEMLDREEIFLQSEIDLTSYAYPNGLSSEPNQRILPISDDNDVRNNLLAPKWLDSKAGEAVMELPLDFSYIPKLSVPLVGFGSAEIMTTNEIAKKLALPLQKTKAAVYIWDARPLLQSSTRIEELNQIAAAGFSHILISFTKQQLDDFSSLTASHDLEALLAAAKSKGIRADLLVGDPTWLEPEHRGELLLLIQQMQKFDFCGLHLDIEPDSLPDAANRRPELLTGLADTVKAVKETTKLPVSLSIHPRYLEGDLGVIAAKKLLPLGLEEVVVMLYSDNPQSTTQRMAAIMTANPNNSFALAQSVEKGIPSLESYAGHTWHEFDAAMHYLEDQLSVHGLKEITIQSWEEYRKGDIQ